MNLACLKYSRTSILCHLGSKNGEKTTHRQDNPPMVFEDNSPTLMLKVNFLVNDSHLQLG